MIKYLYDNEARVAVISRHNEISEMGIGKLWIYQNEIDQDYLSKSKHDCITRARRDVRLCRVDCFVNFTSEGKINSIEYSDVYGAKNFKEIADYLMRERRSRELDRDRFGRLWADYEKLKREKESLEEILLKISKVAVDAV